MVYPSEVAENAVVVVDPYSSGRFLVYELKERRLPIICVRSSLKLSAYFMKSFDSHKSYFAEVINYEDLKDVADLKAHIEKLPYKIVGVFGGSEPGVELADRLSELMGMPTSNGTELLEARKDKAEMQERLRKCGVRAAEQFKSGNLDELVKWSTDRGQWPLVAKPTGGSGSDGIFVCHNETDLKSAHEGIIGKLIDGKGQTQIALQEFLQGDEYIVDTVSYGGKHLCIAIWVYSKRRGLPWNPHAIISECNMLLPPMGEKQDELVSYVFDVLNAVGLQYGPCHTEVMFTPRGPVLVEVNARMHGLQGPRLIELATGISKATYTADAIANNGDLFHKLYQEGRPGRYIYQLQKHCVQMVLISPVQGYLKKSIEQKIKDMNLPSIIEILPAVARGQWLSQSCDLPTAAGSTLMVHASQEQIQADVARIRAAEEDGTLYEVSTEPLPNSPKMSPKQSPKASPTSSPAMFSIEKADGVWGDEFDIEVLPPSEDYKLVGLDD